ncbi:Bifunctional purine biosynthetic protein ade1 [Coniosporium uncinatum]|uniref:Bifunctional purine biosynthetic protein ade1 n=1 Tax=Coniosporium uncinatum TaxID=93489 RepID=A0ACC3D8A4_9PEZI|nr:Bifunctional purine biosynthetic protein ade1 [Coniosporium uncinatum]
MTVPSLRILLVGNGGREHALAWKLSSSPHVEHIYIVPGNGGTASLHKASNISSISADNFSALISFAQEKDINLLVPGPEAPLVSGITDYFNQHAPSIGVFGPSAAAARMEGSKTFSKDFMHRHSIPTAAYRNFSDYAEAKEYLNSVAHSIVIKASGLAAGKGVIIPTSKQEAHDALKEIMLNKEFGAAGDEVVIEEFLEGDEVSILSLCDGTGFVNLPAAQDHKRIFDGDQGPNTGGMGTYAPTPVATKEVLEKIGRTVLEPTLKGMREEGFPMVGCLFTGFMITKTGPKVLEYNVRFGDPETQSCLPLLESDLAEIMWACAEGQLGSVGLRISEKSAATVVVAAGGYPGSYKKTIEMQISPVPEDVVLFHAGTAVKDGKLRTSGGRVIASTASAGTLKEAVNKAYQGVDAIQFEGMQYRKDIAARALR